MRIRGLGVIDDAVLELAPGLTVVTGETGAGKTMVVTGLGLLFGGRADSGVVRVGVDRALVEGRLQVAADDPATAARARGGRRARRRCVAARAVADQRGTVPGVRGRSFGPGVLARRAGRDQPRGARPVATRRGCCARPTSATRSTAMPGPRSPSRSAPTPRRSPSCGRSTTSSASSRPAVANARRRPTCCASASRRSRRSTRSRGRTTALAAEEDRLAHADTLRTAAAGAHDALLGAGDGPEGR